MENKFLYYIMDNKILKSSCPGSVTTCFNEKPISRETKYVVFIDRWSLKKGLTVHESLVHNFKMLLVNHI